MAHHLTLQEREVIDRMRSSALSQTEIPRQLGKADNTFSRELQRKTWRQKPRRRSALPSCTAHASVAATGTRTA